MLPFRPGCAAQHVRRPRLGGQTHALPPFADGASEAKQAGREQRDTDHLAKDRLVAMPAYTGARGVFGDENLLELIGGQSAYRRGGLSQKPQERRDLVGFTEPACLEIVMPAVRHYAALSCVAVELELLERKLADLLKERALLDIR